MLPYKDLRPLCLIVFLTLLRSVQRNKGALLSLSLRSGVQLFSYSILNNPLLNSSLHKVILPSSCSYYKVQHIPFCLVSQDDIKSWDWKPAHIFISSLFIGDILFPLVNGLT